MLYIIAIKETYSEGNLYTIFESQTESIFYGNIEFLEKIIFRHNLKIKNIEIDNKRLKIKTRFNGIHYMELGEGTGGSKKNKNIPIGADYILLCKVENNSYKLVSYTGGVYYADSKELMQHINEDNIANCTIKDGKYESVDVYKGQADNQFTDQITKKYARHLALTQMFGNIMTFEYITEGQEVKLSKYTGTTKDVIIPNFITSIMYQAFYDTKIETVILGTGIKYIGREAFKLCSISEVVIPENVKIICICT